MEQVPHAPWVLSGEVIVAVVSRRGRPEFDAALPEGVGRLPGPLIIVGASYRDSPVGPFVELGVAVPGRVGVRPGYCVIASAVSIPAARVGQRLYWGLPAEAGTLTWLADGDERTVTWKERDLRLVLTPTRRAFRMLVPVRTVQRRGDGPVVVPCRIGARARFGRAEVTVGSDDNAEPGDNPLASLAGSHRGLLLSGTRFVVAPARRPAGLMSSLRAPLHAPEPATASSNRAATVRPLRAHSSVG